MRLQWKYALIVNLAILAVLLVFYVLDDFRAKHELRTIYTTIIFVYVLSCQL